MDLPVLFQAPRTLDFYIPRMTSWFQSLPKLFPLTTQDIFSCLSAVQKYVHFGSGWVRDSCTSRDCVKQSVRLEYWFCFRSLFLALKIQGIASVAHKYSILKEREKHTIRFQAAFFLSLSSGFIPLNKFNSMISWRALFLVFFFYLYASGALNSSSQVYSECWLLPFVQLHLILCFNFSSSIVMSQNTDPKMLFNTTDKI